MLKVYSIIKFDQNRFTFHRTPKMFLFFSVTGYAWMGTVCEGQKTSSVVEYDGTYSTVVNTAHEIAHK